MKLSTDKPGMNLLAVRGTLEDGVVSASRRVILQGGKILRITLGSNVSGQFIPAMECLEWEIDAMRCGVVENGVLYIRNYGTSAFQIDAGSVLGRMDKELYRPRKKKAA